MPLNINGYNATFKAFTDFATRRVAANDENAITDAHVQKPPTPSASTSSMSDGERCNLSEIRV